MSAVEPSTTSPVKKARPDLQSRLDNHFLACSAFAGAAALLASSDASAAIVYNGPKNLVVPVNSNGLYIDLDAGTFSTTDEIAGFDLNFTNRTGTTTKSLSVATGSKTADGIDATVTVYSSSSSSSSYTVTALNKLAGGKLISSTEKFARGGALGTVTTTTSSSSSSSTPTTRYSGAWGHGGTGFVGFRFVSADNTTLYGWAQLAVGADLSTTVVDWAYEDTGGAIIAGQTSENTVTLKAPSPTATEGGQPGKLKFRRSGDLSAPLEVHFKVKSNDAKVGIDYTSLPGSVTIPAGSKSVTLSVGAVDNNVKQGTRRLNFKLLPGYGYLVGKDKKATVSIVDND